ncbi:MAG: cupin domain-containing protein [Burkholderiaceae bacterium]
MNINSDFSERVVQTVQDAVWTASPLAGVDRRMLDRVGGEVARATSVVRYAPGSCFTRHVHDGGEEIFVLQGVCSDERGDYGAGTYLRNPPGTSHAPFSRDGCILFVKLWQIARGDRQVVQVDTTTAAWYAGSDPGLSVIPLHDYRGVNTALVRWAPNTRFNAHTHLGGEEMLVLAGVFRDDDGEYPAGTWVRSPNGSRHAPYTGSEGAMMYVKVGAVGAQFLAPGE